MSTAPKQIQRKRTAGWRMPDGAAYVGRPTVFGNPFRRGQVIELPGVAPIRLESYGAADLYRVWIWAPEQYDLRCRAVAELAGRDLVCWCRSYQACHADVLLELVAGLVEVHGA